ncbi:MAG: hypothetical protein IT240_09285 [Bacteroidia bacterium]|nr:hypothetical protein [Bacteroidia bacterium]MCC6769223.1 hypothetical protein [Bacteroidia bacterium]
MESGHHILEFTEKLPGKEQSNDQERNSRIVNSAISYLAAYVIVYVFFHLVTALVAKKQMLFNKFYYFKVDFSQDYNSWMLEPVRYTFLSGTLFCLALGFISLSIQRFYRKRPGMMKLFLLWLGIHSLNFFCTELALLPIKTSGESKMYVSYLRVFFDYMFWDSILLQISASIAAFLILIVIGAVTAKNFIQLSNSTQHVYKAENRFYYLFQMVFIPFAAGSVISLVFFADAPFVLNITTVFTMFVIVVSLFINGLKNRMIMIYRLPETGQIDNKFLMVLVGALIILKIFLNDGIKF